MDIKLKYGIGAAVLGAAFVALASSPSLAAPAPSCGMNTGAKAEGEPILIGAVVGRTGPDDFSAAAYAAEAYFDCVNANGGIHGRPIQYLVEDDQWSPELSRQLAQKLVVDRKVVAMVANSSYVDCSANAGLYAENGIIAITGVGVPRECFESAAIAPLNAGPRNSSIRVAEFAAKELGSKVIACLFPNVPGVGDWSCEGVAEWGKKHGVEVKNYLVDSSTADATSVLLQMIADGADTVIMGMSKNVAMQYMSIAEQQGLLEKLKFVGPAGMYATDIPGALGPAWDGQFYVNLEFNKLDSTEPDNQNWQAVMDAFASSKASRDSFSQSGYLAARLAVEELLKLDPNAITRKSVNDALANVTAFKSDILCQPWYFDKSATGHAANNGGPTAVTDGDAWRVIGGCPAVE